MTQIVQPDSLLTLHYRISLENGQPLISTFAAIDATADGFGARAKTLVRKRLPCGEGTHVSIGQIMQGVGECISTAAGRRYGNQHAGFARRRALSERGGQHRRIEPIDYRYIGIAQSDVVEASEGLGSFNGTNNPRQTHQKSLR